MMFSMYQDSALSRMAVYVEFEWHLLTYILALSCSYSPPRVDVIGVSVYSSKDFVHWTYQGKGFQWARPLFIQPHPFDSLLSWLLSCYQSKHSYKGGVPVHCTAICLQAVGCSRVSASRSMLVTLLNSAITFMLDEHCCCFFCCEYMVTCTGCWALGIVQLSRATRNFLDLAYL